MKPERLSEIKEMLAAITRGEWDYHTVSETDGDFHFVIPKGEAPCVADTRTVEDARFIAAAPQIVDELAAEIERLQRYRCPTCNSKLECNGYQCSRVVSL